MPGVGAASLVVSQSQLLGRGLPARPDGDASSSARQGRPSAAALSPAPGTKQKMEGSSLNIWITAASVSRWGRRQLSPPGSPVRCSAITSSWQNKKWRVQISIFGLRLPGRPGGDAGSSARQGHLSDAALSPAPGKTKNGGFKSQYLD